MEQRTDLLEIVDFINPASLDYQNWINVGMALKHEGYAAADWDAWSRQDPHPVSSGRMRAQMEYLSRHYQPCHRRHDCADGHGSRAGNQNAAMSWTGTIRSRPTVTG